MPCIFVSSRFVLNESGCEVKDEEKQGNLGRQDRQAHPPVEPPVQSQVLENGLAEYRSADGLAAQDLADLKGGREAEVEGRVSI